MKTTTITSKGQVTIPKEVRELLHVHPGDRVEFRVEEGGRVIVLPIARPFTDLHGLLERRRQRAATLEEMDSSIEDEVARQDQFSRGD